MNYQKLCLGIAVTLFINPTPLGYASTITEELDTIVVSATRIAQHNYKIAGNVSVITREDIEASNARNIPDILNEALGVNVYNNSTSKSSTVDIRGFGETAGRNVLILVNDRKINSIDISGPDLVHIPIDAVERIEIIRGASSVLYGDNAVGGVVNIITKRGSGPMSTKTQATYGSYDSHAESLELEGSNEDLSYHIFSKYFEEGGYRANSDLQGEDYTVRLSYDFPERVSVDLNAGYHEDDQQLPGTLSDSALSTNRRAAATPRDFSFTKDTYINLALNIDPWPVDRYYGEIILDLSYRNRNTWASFKSFSADVLNKIDTKGAAVKYIFDRNIFDHEVNFVTGIDYYFHDNEARASGFFPNNSTITKEEMGTYGFLQYEMLDNLFVNGGTRYHQAAYDFDIRQDNIIQNETPDEWVSMLGMKYEYARGSTLHWNVQQTFRFLATDEWYDFVTGAFNADLEQQTGIQYEIGLKHNLNDKMTLTVTPYWIDITDEIYFNPNGGFLGFGANENYDKTRRVGVEVGQQADILKFMDWSFFDELNFFTTYNFQNPEFAAGANNGKDIPLVPRHQASTGVTATFLKRYNASIIGKYVGARFPISDVANVAVPLKPYYVLDAKLAYKADHYEIFAGINNITDEEYIPFASYSSGFGNYSFPAPERNYTIGCNVKF